jgi:chromosomal replication initiation ATPase DnaA
MITNDILDAELAALLEREKKLKKIREVQIRIQKIEAKMGRVGPAVGKALVIIGRHVCLEFDVRWDEVMGKTKIQYICDARQVVCYLARRFGCSLSGIGLQLRLDHGTVHHAFHKIRDRISVEPKFKPRIATLEETCRKELIKAGLIEEKKLC